VEAGSPKRSHLGQRAPHEHGAEESLEPGDGQDEHDERGRDAAPRVGQVAANLAQRLHEDDRADVDAAVIQERESQRRPKDLVGVDVQGRVAGIHRAMRDRREPRLPDRARGEGGERAVRREDVEVEVGGDPFE
jgi:hypothetical protein